MPSPAHGSVHTHTGLASSVHPRAQHASLTEHVHTAGEGVLALLSEHLVQKLGGVVGVGVLVPVRTDGDGCVRTGTALCGVDGIGKPDSVEWGRAETEAGRDGVIPAGCGESLYSRVF